MPVMGESNFFQGLQIKPLNDETSISQSQYHRELHKKFKINSTM